MMNLSLLAVVLCCLVLLFLKKVVQYFLWRQRIEKIDGPEVKFLAGTAAHEGKITIPNSRFNAIRALVEKYPKCYRLWAGPILPIVVMCAPETAQAVLSSKSTAKPTLYQRLFSNHVGAQSIFISEGDIWKKSRRTFTPAFHFKVLDQYLDEMATIMDEYVGNLHKRKDFTKPLNMETELVSLFLRTLLQSVFSCETDTMKEWRQEFMGLVHKIDIAYAERVESPLKFLSPNWLYLKTEHGKKYNEDSQRMINMCKLLLKERIENNDRKGKFYLDERLALGERMDFLDLCLAQCVGNEKDYEDYIIAQTTTFAWVGYGTVTSAVEFTMYCLAKNKKYQQQCYEEVSQVLKEAGGNLDCNTLTKMKFLTMFFKESTRIFPPVGGIAKLLEDPITIEGVTIEAGTNIFVSIYGLHHNAQVWKDPEVFDPYRFDLDNPEHRNVEARHTHAYLPFSAGPRNCIGQKYAEILSRITLAKVLNDFEFDVAEGYEPQLMPAFSLKSANGVNLILKPRKHD
eukprot:m.117994 g.117994  ORF g.117994 m.117994 type:complete len:513 (-) comp28625_c0_seq1:29-1567(-)